MKTFEESNNRLLDIALRETGYEEGAFGGVFTSDNEFVPMRIITIITVSLATYYRIKPLQADIDFLVKECEDLFNSGFGPFSLGSSYSSLVDKYENLFNGINKILRTSTWAFFSYVMKVGELMNPTWKSTAGNEGSHGYDGTKEYDLSAAGKVLWIDWLGPLYEWIPPKLDWLSPDYYNYEDLNRVENNTEIVASLVGYFIGLPPLEFVTNRDMNYIDFSDSLNRLEANQNVLAHRYTPLKWRQNKLDWKPNDPFSYLDARRLELNMYLLYIHYKGNAEAIPYCGVFNCGEEVI